MSSLTNMPDRCIAVYGNIVVLEVNSLNSAKPNERTAVCEVEICDGLDYALIDTCQYHSVAVPNILK